MNKAIIAGALFVIVILSVVPLVRYRDSVDDFSYDIHGGTALLLHGEADASDLPQPGSAAERPSKEDVERLWPLARDWVVSHHRGAPITNIGLRHMEVAAQSKFADVFITVNTERGSLVYEMKCEWRNGWRVAQWSVAPQDRLGLDNLGKLR